MQRVHSLHNDGFYTVFEASVNLKGDAIFINLRHRNKPVKIGIYANFCKDKMIQSRDGKIVYSGEIAP